MTTINLSNSPVTVNTINNTEGESSQLKTHDISSQISSGLLVFTLSPNPVIDTLIVTLDGLILAPSTSAVQKDYTVTDTNQITLHFSEPLDPNSILLAIYEEA